MAAESDRIAELEELLRQHREATRMAAETAQAAIERLQAAELVILTASAWRHAHDAPDAGAITRVVRCARELRDRIDVYEATWSKS